MQKRRKDSETAIIIFVKVPESGFVKTRLTQTTCLTEIDTAKIAEAMLKDTLILSSKSEALNICIGFTPKNEQEKLENIIASIEINQSSSNSFLFFSQTGSNFDERFTSIIEAGFKANFRHLVILGADLPYLDPLFINYSFNRLSEIQKKERIVIGPASGGGIYLVGITNNFNPGWFTEYNLFRGGVETSQFVDLCKTKGLDMILLPPLIDVDIEEDLVSLITYIEAMESAAIYKNMHYPRFTADIIKELGIYIEKVPGETRNRKINKR